MRITIETTDVDLDIVEGFAVATSWRDTGKTKEEWMQDRVNDYIRRTARQGLILRDTQSIRDSLRVAAQAAATNAASKIGSSGLIPKP